MIITLRKADFSLSNIGTLNTWSIIRSLGTGASYSGPTYVNKNATFNAIITLDEGYEIGSAGITITMGNIRLDSSVYSIVDNIITISITAVTGNINITVPTLNSSSGEENNGNNNPNNIITWEMGAIVTNSGSNSNDTNMKKSRIRTKNCLKVIDKMTISCSGNAEFCPVYYDADETFISSPNAYQTTPITIDSNIYPLVRIMARDKTNTNSCSLDLGKNIIVSGNFTETPFISEISFEDGTVPPLLDTVVWRVSAINSNNGTITSSMKTRIITNRIPLSDSTITITPTGDAEIYAFWYDSNGTMTSASPAYQTDPIVTSNKDGHSICIMARNKTNTSANLTKDFGNNIVITK